MPALHDYAAAREPWESVWLRIAQYRAAQAFDRCFAPVILEHDEAQELIRIGLDNEAVQRFGQFFDAHRTRKAA